MPSDYCDDLEDDVISEGKCIPGKALRRRWGFHLKT